MSAGAGSLPPAEVTEEVLAALALPPVALARWLDDVEAFCRDHGGARHYRELLALVAGTRAAAANAGQMPGPGCGSAG
jgi:hypothetical protein